MGTSYKQNIKMQNTKKRYEFIDLMKGVCILLVVATHLDLPGLSYPCLSLFRMPLYYLLSGIFFSRYNGFITFLIKKTNNLIIPYLFFSIPTIFVVLLKLPERLSNGPIWFLVSLFLVGILIYIITYLNNIIIESIIVFILAFVGWLLCQYRIILPLFGTTALCGLPFYYFGYLLRHLNILDNNKHLFIKFLVYLSIFLIISFIIIPGRELALITSEIPYGFHWFILSGLSGTLALFYIAKMIDHIKPLNYFGRYSVIILCTHWYFVKTWQYFIPYEFMNNWWFLWLIFLFAIGASVPTIYLMKRYLPWMCAQKPLINTNNIQKL